MCYFKKFFVWIKDYGYTTAPALRTPLFHIILFHINLLISRTNQSLQINIHDLSMIYNLLRDFLSIKICTPITSLVSL